MEPKMALQIFRHISHLVLGLAFIAYLSIPAIAAEDLPWGQSQPPRVVTPDSGPVLAAPRTTNNDPYYGGPGNGDQRRSYDDNRGGDYYSPAPQSNQRYDDNRRYDRGYDDRRDGQYGGGDPYARPVQPYPGPQGQPGPYADDKSRGFTSEEIAEAGRSFFGTVSNGLASVIEYAFQQQGRPNGYILGEEAGGAFIAGLRYGEGRLYTRSAGQHKVYWQGPSLGYDFGAEGSKTMILVYNLSYPEQIYKRFSGIDGSAYLVGGVGITFQKRGNVVLAPIRSGVGVRLGANVGYLKYSRYPTWNPF